MKALIETCLKSGGCVGLSAKNSRHADMDAWGKERGMTITFADWHPHPEYRIFETGSMPGRNESYPAGLVIVNEDGKPSPWQSCEAVLQP